MVTAAMAMPVVDVSVGRRLLSASLFLSSRRLLLLARSRRLFPDGGAWVLTSAAELLPLVLAAGLNQRHTSSDTPSVSSTNLAGTPSRLQHAHAKYWLCALGRGRGEEPASV